MTAIDRFLNQLKVRGLEIRWDGLTPRISGPKAALTPEVVAACKAFKEQLIALKAGTADETCPRCRRIVTPVGQQCGCASELNCPYKKD